MHRVIKAFPLSRDGVTATLLSVGEVVSIPATLVAGLEREGFIAAVTPKVEAAVVPPLENRADVSRPSPAHPNDGGVVIPSWWRDMPWPQMRSLAASLSDAPIRNKDDAEAAIVAAGG